MNPFPPWQQWTSLLFCPEMALLFYESFIIKQNVTLQTILDNSGSSVYHKVS